MSTSLALRRQRIEALVIPGYCPGVGMEDGAGAWSRELMSYLPENYPASPETVAFQEALQPEVADLWWLRREVLLQMDPYTATWGLPLWEEALGISSAEGLELEVRRRQVVAKLQGRGTTTVKVVQDLAETLLGVPVKITEWYSEYRVELEPESGGKLPAGAQQLRERLLEILPAHLDFQVLIRTWAEYIIGVATGPRHSTTPLPKMTRDMPGQHIHYGMGLGPRFTTAVLPGFARDAPSPPVYVGVGLGPRFTTAQPPRAHKMQADAIVSCAIRTGGPRSCTDLPAYQRR